MIQVQVMKCWTRMDPLWGMGEATPIIATPIESSPSSSSSEAQAAWARPLQSSTSSSLLRSRRSLSLFWWLVILIVGGWVDGGRLIRLWVWDLGWYWCLSLGWSGWLILVDRVLIVVFVWVVFFFLVAVADIGGRWLICGVADGCGLWRLIYDVGYCCCCCCWW